MSTRNSDSATIEDRILDAAADCVLAFGVDRVMLAEIARRAGVSRPTVYRRWPDTRAVLAALLTRRIVGVLDAAPSRGVGRAALVERIVTIAERLRADEVVMSVLRKAPDLAMVYIAERMGTSQQILLDAVAADIKLAQEQGSVRPGEPRRLAAMCLLITQSAIQSAQIVAPMLDADELAVELAHSLNGYLRP
ncbi:bacterial regulatory s, tetR family protein [Mycolicibacterium hassiacum DSM 44199]|jgi:AcrR family transcriptional regulator|uniref:Bacterial regulatory s, tetR family protein n=1 Tax=Mycolicibacterium hassiacum (strain DSM 44199 / CIP 105218 / JCM 12690 / 3849) TaxID=1122247 RepID=K5BB33_MYCHD|nr:TetR/AcrR family transcriptional regulator [Mycolicibacterium hassiacum]EKF23290.1 bacterial regulatory s, tetR family protein [Mycolicibacterium hassiacum DSM 44199]MBX5487357.1 TetR/AcrR family transcriptional regulator [Mycolicibacterium hassiacum]MDA4086448.1 TetR family transcriptional regulator [Mycolicibacterium hassiacum DSM 44199]PZN23062.1 MAG: TetR/AcrR family transcriptional regulator [Mycolicibacterium hassiacum]VCT89747.1 putative HTH-type transcriptional regulator [Mycoliciba